MATKSFTKFPSLNSLVVCIIALLILLFLQLIQSCKKETGPAANPIAFLSVINTSPTVGTYNFYLNQSKVNSGALSFGGTIPYFQIKAGEYDAKLSTESSAESLLTKKLTLEKDKIYSLFFIDRASNLDYLLISDDLKNPPAEKAFIRFINLSPDAPALDLTFKDSTTIVVGKAYKATSDFIEIDPKTYNFQITDKATGAEEGDALEKIDIQKGKIYTIISRGLLNPLETDRPFSGQLISN